MRFLLYSSATIVLLTAVVSAQSTVRRPGTPQPTNIPLQQSSVPQFNPNGNRTGLPSTTVYTSPPRYYGGYGPTYIINNNNNANAYPYGYPSGGFTGNQAPSGQFYAILGGPAPSNPFISNANPMQQTWQNTTGVNANGQPWQYPFNFYNFNNMPQYPQIMNNAPVVGQTNGFFPNQQPGGPVQPNNFGIQAVPGINAIR